jgi:hypothetical protein
MMIRSKQKSKTKHQKKLAKREHQKKEEKNFERSVNKLLAKYDPELIANIEGLTEFCSSSKMEQMFKNYQQLMEDRYNQKIEPSKIPEVQPGAIDPRRNLKTDYFKLNDY